MIVKTKAIVISSVKYAESDLIVKCYTQEGLKSYLLKRILKAKKGKLKVAYFQPLTQLELIASHNNKTNLNYIKEAKVVYPYTTVHTNIIKQTIIIFLSEILNKTLKEEEANVQLFQFLETSLKWLDTHDLISNFHLLFMLNLSKHLGFYPDNENSHFHYFNMEQGVFWSKNPLNEFLSDRKLDNFKKLLGTNFDGISALKFKGEERLELLEVLIRYFELHLPGFQTPKSLTVLKAVFV